MDEKECKGCTSPGHVRDMVRKGDCGNGEVLCEAGSTGSRRLRVQSQQAQGDP
jgi:hypothetical protein